MAAATVARPTYTAGRAGGKQLQWTAVVFRHPLPLPLPDNSLTAPSPSLGHEPVVRPDCHSACHTPGQSDWLRDKQVNHLGQ